MIKLKYGEIYCLPDGTCIAFRERHIARKQTIDIVIQALKGKIITYQVERVGHPAMLASSRQAGNYRQPTDADQIPGCQVVSQPHPPMLQSHADVPPEEPES